MTKNAGGDSSTDKTAADTLSRRERQIMDIVYSLGKATAAQVHIALPDAPGYSAVRATMRILEEKGHLRHENLGKVYVYLPVKARGQAAQSKLRQVVQTFFGGSVEQTVATLLSAPETKLSNDELDRLSALIEKAKKEGR
jgi:predicted transcriptional regulator